MDKLNDTDYQKIIYDWNDTNASFPKNKTLHQLFQEQVRRTPNHIAVIYKGQQFTYRELNERANQLARYIRKTYKVATKKSLKRDTLVALCLDRSLEMIVAILGVLKAGGAYVPISPSYPSQRILYILEDSQSRLLITQKNLEKELFLSTSATGASLIALNEQSYSQEKKTNLKGKSQAGDLAYVMYTSGTTGKPKGVMVEHRGVASFSINNNFIDYSKVKVVAGVSSYTFDGSVFDIFLSLLNGKSLVLFGHNEILNLNKFSDGIMENNVDTILFPTSLFSSFVFSEASFFNQLTQVLVGGDAIEVSVANKFKSTYSRVSLKNLYGPTEAIVCSSFCDLSVYETVKKAPIGSPLNNKKLFVVDSNMKPVPLGVVGELYIGGAGLARGYLNEPELTKESFIQNPFATKEDIERGYDRLYKTGDLVCWLPDGNLDYIGRSDSQVKIRGYRVELGEIESELRNLESVQQACVIVKKIGEDKKLVAYYTTASGLDENKSKNTVSLWEDHYNRGYQHFDVSGDHDNDFSGWKSSYDGENIPLDDMQLWRSGTVNRILDLSPRNVIEIGVGSGLLLYKLIGHVDSYLATDFSEVAIERLEEISKLENMSEKIVAMRIEADQVKRELLGRADCIIINSVCQYFPTLDYFEKVLLNAVEILDEGGKVFVGDVRDFRLLDVFKYDIEITKGNSVSADDIYSAALREVELTISPSYFIEFSKRHGLGADVLIKVEDIENELTLYRYDVVLSKLSKSDYVERADKVDNVLYSPNMDIAKTLYDYSGMPLVINNYPRSVIVEKVNQYRRLLGEPEAVVCNSVLDVPELLRVAKESGHSLKISNVAESRHQTELLLIFTPIGYGKSIYTSDFCDGWHEEEYANIPFTLQFSPYGIKERLCKVLPDFMVPDIFMHIRRFPLNVNGKLDRAELPDPLVDFADSKGVPAKTEQEISICKIWKETLGLQKIGVTDSFFKIGGNSILAIKAIYKMGEIFGSYISVEDIFKYETIEKLAALLDDSYFPPLMLLKATDASVFPLSYAQERLWFIEQYQSGATAYHIPLLLELNKGADIDSIKQALRAIVSRHEILRSVFKKSNNGSDCQQVRDEPLEILEEKCEEQLFQVVISAAINKPFCLREGYPIRVAIYQVKRKYYLLINIHHLACDGWSMDVFYKEFYQYYAHYNKGERLSLPELDIQYKDFALWQRGDLWGEVLDGQVSYWKERLSGYEPLNLMTDKVRPNQIDYHGLQIRFELGEVLSRKLRFFSQKKDCTLYTILLSGFYVLLSKYSGQDDIVIGAPIANRHYSQVQDLMGLFVNTLVLREQIDADMPISKLIKQIHQHLIEAQSYQDFPFERVVEALNVERDSSRNPIFQVMFGVQNFGGSHQDHASPQLFKEVDVVFGHQVSRFDLDCFLDDSTESISGVMTYATSLYHKETVEQFIQHYTQILQYIADESDRPISDYCLLIKDEYQKVVYDWNQTDRYHPKNRTLCQLFQAQVKQTPSNVAVIFEGRKVTYQELNEKSNQLARYIRKKYKGITKKTLKPDTLIAIFLERSHEMIVGILGILKAGGAYVPIEPNYPKNRINYILEDTKSKFLLTQQSLSESLSSIVDEKATQLIFLDTLEYSKEEKRNLISHSKGRDLAYVIYTSGTAGKPKGVMVDNNAFSRFLLGFHGHLVAECGYDNYDVLSLTNYTFDIFGLEYALPLLVGDKVILSSIDKVSEADIMASTIVQQTPSVLLNLALLHPNLLNEKLCLVGGEVLPYSVAKVLKASFKEVINVYGPAETVIWSTSHRLQSESDTYIGKPLANEKVYVLDKYLNPVPIGVVGELYIGGAGLARGYLNKPELTAERFIANPLATKRDVKQGYVGLYKTGDLVRWLVDGSLEYIGRNDFQVKIRGYRIELGEIENALLSIEGIKQACALVKEKSIKGELNQYLVAYYVKEDIKSVQFSITDASLLAALQGVLPEYMMPSALMELDVLPLTVNGKLDRKALPAPIFYVDVACYRAPKNEMEMAICQLWQEMLDLERVGVQDDFFRMGGNSILAVQLISLLNIKFKSQLVVRDIFSHKTVERVALLVEKSLGDFKYDKYLIESCKQEKLYELFPLTNIQQAYLYGRLDSFELGGVSTHVYIELLFSDINVRKLEDVLNFLIERHSALRTIFSNDAQQVLQSVKRCVVKYHGIVEENNLAKIRDRLSHKVYVADTFPLFDFEVSCYQEKSILHLSFDALIMDGTSLGVFFRELTYLYNASDIFLVDLPEILFTFRDYMEEVTKIRASDLFEKDKAYWLDKLNDYNFDMRLPMRVSPAEIEAPKFARITKTIAAKFWKKIVEKAKRYQISPTSIVLFSYGVILSKWSGQSSFSINLTLFNRLPLHQNINDILGDFTVLELFNFRRNNQQTIRDALYQVHQELWSDIEHNLFDGIDFQRLIVSGQLPPVLTTDLF